MRFPVLVTALAGALHFIWENIQCPLLYTHGSYDASMWGMLQATFGDVVITWLLYGWAAIVAGRWRWMVGPSALRGWLSLELGAFAVGFAIEWHALVTGRWSYLDAMPTLTRLEVGLVPILQLMILTPVSAGLVELWLRRARPGP